MAKRGTSHYELQVIRGNLKQKTKFVNARQRLSHNLRDFPFVRRTREMIQRAFAQIQRGHEQGLRGIAQIQRTSALNYLKPALNKRGRVQNQRTLELVLRTTAQN